MPIGEPLFRSRVWISWALAQQSCVARLATIAVRALLLRVRRCARIALAWATQLVVSLAGVEWLLTPAILSDNGLHYRQRSCAMDEGARRGGHRVRYHGRLGKIPFSVITRCSASPAAPRIRPERVTPEWGVVLSVDSMTPTYHHVRACTL